MVKYLTEEQLKSNLRLGMSIEQWLSFDKKDDYVILKWLRIDTGSDQKYSVSYFESFDEGNKEFLDIYEFSLTDPDEPFGIRNLFDSMEDALNNALTIYSASIEKFVSAGMIQDEYLNYFNTQR